MLHHVVMFKLSDSQEADEAVRRLRAMQGKIPALMSVRAGRNAKEGPNAFDIVLVTVHRDADGLADYASDDIHQEVLNWLSPRITERAVVDTTELS